MPHEKPALTRIREEKYRAGLLSRAKRPCMPHASGFETTTARMQACPQHSDHDKYCFVIAVFIIHIQAADLAGMYCMIQAILVDTRRTDADIVINLG